MKTIDITKVVEYRESDGKSGESDGKKTKKYLIELIAENKIQATGTFRNRTYHII